MKETINQCLFCAAGISVLMIALFGTTTTGIGITAALIIAAFLTWEE